MKTRNQKTSFSEYPQTFAGLCKMLPPRPIHDEVDWQNVTEVIEAMAGHRLNADQEDYLEVLSGIVGVYEDDRHRKDLSHIKPVDSLRYLVEQNGLTASGLGELLGNRSLGSKLLRGERELSKANIRMLAKRFKVSAELFL